MNFPWTGKITAWNAALRKGPHKSASHPHESTLADLPRGTFVTVLSQYGGWLGVSVQLSKRTLNGYVSQELLERVLAPAKPYTQEPQKRIFFAAGAGNDQIGWNYTKRFEGQFLKRGFRLVRVNASHDNPQDLKKGSKPIGDIFFTTKFRYNGYDLVRDGESDPLGSAGEVNFEEVRVRDDQVKIAFNFILANISNWPLARGEALNLVGYSYGSVLLSHVALRLSDQKKTVGNLILIGSPIPSDSPLYRELSSFTKVIRYDIPGDYLSNPPGFWTYCKGAKQNSSDGGPHFDLARPDNPSTKNIDEGAQTEQRISKALDSIIPRMRPA